MSRRKRKAKAAGDGKVCNPDLLAAVASLGIGSPEVLGLRPFLLQRWARLDGEAKARVVDEGRALSRALDRRHLEPDELAAAVDVVTRYARSLRGRQEVSGMPVCVRGCREDLLLVVDGVARCALCDGPVASEVAA